MENTVISAREARNRVNYYKNHEWSYYLEGVNREIENAADSGNFSCRVKLNDVFEEDIIEYLQNLDYSVWIEDGPGDTYIMQINWEP